MDLFKFVQEHHLRLENIHTQVCGRQDNWWSRKYTRQGNARNNRVSWEVEYGIFSPPEFVDT
jgi:hypothetical protein